MLRKSPHANEARTRARGDRRRRARRRLRTAGKRPSRKHCRPQEHETAGHLGNRGSRKHSRCNSGNMERQPDVVPLRVEPVRRDRSRMRCDRRRDRQDLHRYKRRRGTHTPTDRNGEKRQRERLGDVSSDGGVPTNGCPSATGTIPVAALAPPERLQIASASLSPALTRSTNTIRIRVGYSGM